MYTLILITIHYIEYKLKKQLAHDNEAMTKIQEYILPLYVFVKEAIKQTVLIMAYYAIQ